MTESAYDIDLFLYMEIIKFFPLCVGSKTSICINNFLNITWVMRQIFKNK